MNERQRIQKIIESEQITAKEFAVQVGISAGTISNIMGGRNRPSLEVMQAILDRYRTVSADWLILGVGSMYRTVGCELSIPFEEDKPEIQPRPSTISAPVVASVETEPKVVKKIVVFYTDGTFEER